MVWVGVSNQRPGWKLGLVCVQLRYLERLSGAEALCGLGFEQLAGWVQSWNLWPCAAMVDPRRQQRPAWWGIRWPMG